MEIANSAKATTVSSLHQSPGVACSTSTFYWKEKTASSIRAFPFSSSSALLSPWKCRWSHNNGGKICHRRGSQELRVESLDAAQPFDYESIQEKKMEDMSKLKIGIVGFGNFGQFLAKRFAGQGHSLLAFSRTDYTEDAQRLGVHYFRDADDFCEEHPDVVVLCTSILSTEKVLRSLPVQRLKRSTLIVDVLSVKEFPRRLFLQLLPREFDILCTHPMFGPESGRGSWKDLTFMYDRVRIGGGRAREQRCQAFINIFEKEGCSMVEMSCEEHDKYAAGSQFITHTVGRVLGKLGLQSTPINTKGYETLLKLVENTAGDSFDLYYGLFMYNNNATEELERLEQGFDAVKKQLFDQLHDVLRKQLFEGATTGTLEAAAPVPAPNPLRKRLLEGGSRDDEAAATKAKTTFQNEDVTKKSIPFSMNSSGTDGKDLPVKPQEGGQV